MLRVVPPFGEHLPLKHIPAAVQPGFAHPVRQCLQIAQVSGVLFHQHGVVVHLRLDKRILRRVLVLRKLPVHKQPFHPGVPLPTGVAGQIHPLGVVVRAAQTCPDNAKLVLAQLGGFLQKNHIVLYALVLQQVAVAVTVPKHNPAAVVKPHLVVLPVVPHRSGAVQRRKLLLHGQNNVFAQLRKRLAHHQHPQPRVPQAHSHGLGARHPAFSAAARPAVGNVLFPPPHKLHLLCADGIPHGIRHSNAPLSSGSTTTMPLSSAPSPSILLTRSVTLTSPRI